MNRMIVLHDLMKRKRRREEFEMENAIIASIIAQLMEDELNFSVKCRSAPLYRKRWDSVYLRDLAERENSFVAEY